VVIRALGHLAGGETAEDTVIINGPSNLEQVRVDLVELYTTVTDRDRRPVTDLGEADFRVFEDGVEQEIVRFERVENTPVRVTLLLDVSASMEERLDPVLRAAARFFDDVVGERDRLSVVTFNDRPRMSAPFTNDREDLAEGLLGLSAERGTALYDSLIYALFHLNGLEGQRAVLLLSDGLDEHSHYDFEQTLEYARRSRAAIYPVAIGLSRKDRAKSGRSLERLARESGGYATFLDDLGGVDEVYDAIARELRSKYLIAYQSTNQQDDESFRTVEVKVGARGAEAHTIRGYYP
jgi:VWFA-related protein